MNKTDEFNMGRKRLIEIEMVDGSVKKIQLSKSTSYDTDLVTGDAMYIEPNKDGTYRLSHGSKMFQSLDDIVSIKIIREDFK